ncbi:panthothenate synthetase [Flavobacterium aquiphilum]|uniref:panthothenate synthetase n=1 Tax=Flavobacterium aquiphilum TaxID=3003261 RepID=UPI00247FB75B|nr:panthothenate synthetase [Flavobacterium aquiphilum]
MKMLINVIFPIEPFNSMVRNGTAGETIGRVIDDIKPESIYFSEQDGSRGAVMIVEIPDASSIPAICEPWFLNFEAHCEIRIAMTPEDLMRANLNKLAEKWSDVHAN